MKPIDWSCGVLGTLATEKRAGRGIEQQAIGEGASDVDADDEPGARSPRSVRVVRPPCAR